HMMNNLPGWVFLVSRDGYYVRLNRRFAEVTGYTNGELWGMDYTEVVAPPDKARVIEAFHTGFDEGYVEVEARITSKSGESTPYLFVVSRVTLEDEPYLLGVGLDISQRLKAEENNRLLRSAVENATEAILLTEGRTETPGPRIVYANNAFLQMTGYTHEEIVGRVPWFLMGPKTDMRVIRELRDHLREGQSFSGETTNYRKDRTEFISEWSVAPVRDKSGEVTHFVAIQRDVTERRRLQSQLWSSMRLDSIGRLAGGVAHDFNNLLAVIMGYSELVASSLEKDSPIASDIEDIRQAAKRGGELTRQLLAFSRRQVLTRRVIQLNEVVIHMERMLTRIIGADIELQLDLAKGLWPAKLDIAQMEQVLLNLAVNAREAMPRGGRLIMETSNVELDEAGARRDPSITPGPHIMLTITDTGRGMDKATADNIFEPFFTTKERDLSAGLGLATVYGIVKQSGGDIWVYSEPGKGTTFKILFPAASQDEHIPAAESETPSQAAGGSETVLLVEDEDAVREIMERTLTRHGYTVLTASSGPQALELAAHHEGPIHLLVTDIIMPGMSGYEVAKTLAERRPGLNILCVSGYPKNIIAEDGMLVSGAEYLEKPFTPAVLAERVRHILDKDG
ncbi:MAG: PAS domain S-box protein, partial [Candidatus Hydrogenedentota bacterium]